MRGGKSEARRSVTTMQPFQGHLDHEQLLGNAGWMKSLAMALLRDEGRAEDVVQQAWVASIERPGRDPDSLRAWLHGVVRNLALKIRRTEMRRERRERLAARPEAQPGTPEEILERAEVSREVLDAVIALDEPYRSTVLLRYYEDREPEEIARAQGVAPATVRTRLSRAIGQLRDRLNGVHGGDRKSWRVALGIIVGLDAVAADAALGGAASASSGSGAGVAGAAGGSGTAAASAAAGAAWTAGGTLVATKTVLIGSGACLFALIAGFGISRLAGPRSLEDHLREGAVVERGKLEALEKDLEDARGRLKAAAAAREEEAARTKGLEEKLASLTKDLESRKAADVARVAASKKSKAPISFGKYGDLDGVRNADWAEAAEAAGKINGLLLELLDRVKQGQPPPEDLRTRIRDENNKLIKVYGGLAGRIPTNSPMNGEYTHPICLFNLMAAMLDNAAVALDGGQNGEIVRLGGEFEDAYEDLQGRYGKETLALEKIVDEMELKEKYVDAAFGELSDEQRLVVAHPDLHDRKGLDLLSPFLSAVLFAEPRYVESPEAYRDQYISQVLKNYSLGDEGKAALGPAFDEYFAAVEPLLKEPKDPEKDFLELDPSLVAARAHVKVLIAVSKIPGLDEKARANLQRPSWTVPQLKKTR
jgi:RNA polymerase sigma factor (sigma-70 family)